MAIYKQIFTLSTVFWNVLIRKTAGLCFIRAFLLAFSLAVFMEEGSPDFPLKHFTEEVGTANPQVPSATLIL